MHETSVRESRQTRIRQTIDAFALQRLECRVRLFYDPEGCVVRVTPAA